MANREPLSCTCCDVANQQGVQTSFLGLRRFTCAYCLHPNTFPATRGMITFCWILVGVMGLISVNALSQGNIPLPGLLGIAAVMVLVSSGSARRRVEKERADFANERYLSQKRGTPPPLPPQ